MHSRKKPKSLQTYSRKKAPFSLEEAISLTKLCQESRL